jgi:uncharacterized protein (DUF433 family)
MALPLIPEKLPLNRDSDGVMRVGGTRVSPDTVVAAFLEGATSEEIAQQYPSLDLADVYSVISYYLRHRDEVHGYLQNRQASASRVRQENEARFDPSGIRERLLARRAQEGCTRSVPDKAAEQNLASPQLITWLH